MEVRRRNRQTIVKLLDPEANWLRLALAGFVSEYEMPGQDDASVRFARDLQAVLDDLMRPKRR